MVNKKGWLRIVEASIVIGIIFGMLAFIHQQQTPGHTNNQGQYITEQLLVKADEISKNDQYRREILSDNPSNAITFLNSGSGTLAYTITVCAPDAFVNCNLAQAPAGQEIYAAEHIISTNLTMPAFAAKKFIVYAWLR